MTEQKNNAAVVKFIAYSLFGIFMFFFPLELGGKSTIPVDHIITFITTRLASFAKYYILLVMYMGAVLPFVRKTWKKDSLTVFFSLAKIGGALIGTILVFNLNPPAWLARADFGPFLYTKLSTPVGLVIPIGSVFLAFLANFGLMEFTGVFMTPVMKPLFKTPGRSAIDAVASFVGSYSIALLITNGVYRQGKYSAREAAIIATGFSTVSATFLLIVAKTLKLMDYWGTFFFVAMLVTFIVTALTARLWPLAAIPDSYFTKEKVADEEYTGNILQRAWQAGISTAAKTEPLFKLICDNLFAGLNMACNVIPSIMSIGLLGLVLAEFTPFFDWFGFIFVPLFKLMGVEQAVLAGKAAAVSLPEMFLPSILIAKTGTPLLKFVIAVVSISEILFFSASIPCVLGTDIPLSLKEIVIIWWERVVLSIIVTIPLALLLGFSDVVPLAGR